MTETKPAEQHKREGLGAFLTNNRRAVIVLGALIALASYFAKDVFSERTKEKAAAISSGASAYLASMSELRGQLNEIFNAGQIPNVDPASVPRDSVLAFIGSLTSRAQTNTLQLSAFLKSMPDALLLKGPEADEIMKRTIQVSDAGKDFLAHPPTDTTTFHAGAKSLIQRFTDLEDATGKVGADLKIFANEFSEKLEHESQHRDTESPQLRVRHSFVPRTTNAQSIFRASRKPRLMCEPLRRGSRRVHARSGAAFEPVAERPSLRPKSCPR